jgi:hypothetical protein
MCRKSVVGAVLPLARNLLATPVKAGLGEGVLLLVIPAFAGTTRLRAG